MPKLNIHNFTPSQNGKIGTGVRFSHDVRRGVLLNNPKTWICKQINKPKIAELEVLAQEFFRVIIPDQPETRLAVDPTTNQHYVLSEEVQGYRNLPRNEAKKFNDGTYTGLGQVMLISMFIQEIDLKNGNLGLDANKKVKKIDGDWSFAGAAGRPFNDKEFELTPDGIANLPYPTGYYAFNWLDLINENEKKPNSSIVNQELCNSPQFRAEVNEAMFKICLLPDSFIELFVTSQISGISGERQTYIELIKARRDELKQSALQNNSFVEYLKTDTAKIDARDLFEQMKSIQSCNRNIVPVDKQQLVRYYFSKTLIAMRNFETEEAKLLSQAKQLLDQLGDIQRARPEDKHLSTYILQKKEVIQRVKHQTKEIEPLITDLHNRLQQEYNIRSVNILFDKLDELLKNNHDKHALVRGKRRKFEDELSKNQAFPTLEAELKLILEVEEISQLLSKLNDIQRNYPEKSQLVDIEEKQMDLRRPGTNLQQLKADIMYHLNNDGAKKFMGFKKNFSESIENTKQKNVEQQENTKLHGPT